jgi:hypothetical protein
MKPLTHDSIIRNTQFKVSLFHIIGNSFYVTCRQRNAPNGENKSIRNPGPRIPIIVGRGRLLPFINTFCFACPP